MRSGREDLKPVAHIDEIRARMGSVAMAIAEQMTRYSTLADKLKTSLTDAYQLGYRDGIDAERARNGSGAIPDEPDRPMPCDYP